MVTITKWNINCKYQSLSQLSIINKYLWLILFLMSHDGLITVYFTLKLRGWMQVISQTILFFFKYLLAHWFWASCIYAPPLALSHQYLLCFIDYWTWSHGQSIRPWVGSKCLIAPYRRYRPTFYLCTWDFIVVYRVRSVLCFDD